MFCDLPTIKYLIHNKIYHLFFQRKHMFIFITPHRITLTEFPTPINRHNKKNKVITRRMNGCIHVKSWHEFQKENSSGSKVVVHRINDVYSYDYMSNVDSDGEIWKECLHRVDGPATIIYHENGNIRCEMWYTHGIERDSKIPSTIEYYETGEVQTLYWYKDGMIHRDSGPAVIMYYENGKIKKEVWYDNGIIHMDDGPARITYCKNGNVVKKEWY